VPVAMDRSATPGTIRLEGEIDIARAAELKEVLVQALRSKSEIRIALGSATGIDVTAMQLLWAAEREAKASGVALALDGPVPETLRATLRAAGFERFPLSDETAPASEVG
jgi:anti-sigma B factor antagonist